MFDSDTLHCELVQVVHRSLIQSALLCHSPHLRPLQSHAPTSRPLALSSASARSHPATLPPSASHIATSCAVVTLASIEVEADT